MKASLKHFAALMIFIFIVNLNIPVLVSAEQGDFQETGRITAYDIASEGEYIYIVGDAVNFGDLPGDSLDLRGGLRDIWLVKLERDGTPIFTALIGGGDNDSAYSIAVQAGVVYILGETWSSDFPGAPGNAGENDVLLLALAADGGQILWARRFGGSDQDSGRALMLFDDALYLTGITWSNDLLPGASRGNADGYLARVRLDGGLEWMRIFGGSALDAPYDLTVSDEFIWVAGQTSSRDFGGTHQGEGDAFAARFNIDGQVQNTRLYGGREADVAFAISPYDNGGVLMAGGTKSATLPEAIGDYSENYDGFLMYLNSEGELQRTVYFGGIEVEYAYDIHPLPEGDVIVVGETFSPNFPLGYDEPQVNNGSGDAFILLFNSNGDLINNWMRGGVEEDLARAVILSNNGLWLAGNFTIGDLSYGLLIPGSELADIPLPTTEPFLPTATLGPTATPQPTETLIPSITITQQPSMPETGTAVGEPATLTPTSLNEEVDNNETIEDNQMPTVVSTDFDPADPTYTVSPGEMMGEEEGSTLQDNGSPEGFPIWLLVGGGLLLGFGIGGAYYLRSRSKEKNRSE